MGLGKSLTMISLIVSNPAQLTSSVLFTQQGTIRHLKSTLIVVPYSCELSPLKSHSQKLIDLKYWILGTLNYNGTATWQARKCSLTDCRRHLKPNSLSWLRFHSSQKRKMLSVGSYDIVITTYETLMGQQKKHNDPTHTDTTLFSFAWHRIVLDEGWLPKPKTSPISNTLL